MGGKKDKNSNNKYLRKEAQNALNFQKNIKKISSSGGTWTGSSEQLFLLSLFMLLANAQAIEIKNNSSKNNEIEPYNKKKTKLAVSHLGFSTIFKTKKNSPEKRPIPPEKKNKEKPSRHILTTQEKLDQFIDSIPYTFDNGLSKNERQKKKSLVQNALHELSKEERFQYIFELLRLSKDFSIVITENDSQSFWYQANENILGIHSALLTKDTKIFSQLLRMHFIHELGGHAVIRESNIQVFSVKGVDKTGTWAGALDLPIKKTSKIPEEVFSHLSELMEIYGNAKKIVFDNVFPLYKKYEKGVTFSNEEKIRFEKYVTALKHYEPWVFYRECSKKEFDHEPKQLKDTTGGQDEIHYLHSYPPLTFYTHGFYKMNNKYIAIVSTIKDPFDNSIKNKIESFLKDMIVRNQKDNLNFRNFIRQIYPNNKEYTNTEINFAKKFIISVEFVSDTEGLSDEIKETFFKGYKEYFQERKEKINKFIKENTKVETIEADNVVQKKENKLSLKNN